MPSGGPRRYPAVPGVVLLLMFFSLFLVPQLLRREAVRRLEAWFALPVTIADVTLNPFTGRVGISGLVIGGSRPVLRVPTLDLILDRNALFRRDVIIHRVTAHQLALYLERTGPTRWNVDQIFRSQAEGSGGVGEFTIEQIQVKNGSITVVDRTTTPVVTNLLQDLDLTLQPVPMTPEAEPGQIVGKARLEEGTVQMEGTLHLNPFKSHLQVTATAVPFANFQGYVNELLGRTEALAGELDGRLDLSAAWTQPGHLTVEAHGTVEGRRLAFSLRGEKEPAFVAVRLKADLARASMTPTLHAEIANVQLIGATLRIVRDRDGTFNVRQLWAASPEHGAAGAPPPPGPAKAQALLAIRHLEARDSRIEFVDATLTPTFTGVMSEVAVEIQYPRTATDRATLKLTGLLGGSAPIALRGWFTPVTRPLKLYVEGAVQDYELSRVNPYAEKYVRHRVRRGRVTTEIKYRYDGGTLAAGNEIQIRHIKLGNIIDDEFHEQVGIPLKLALALLEGVDGEIRLRIPVKGDITNPKFRFNSVVWKAVRNAVLKTIAAPFRMLGQILTVGGKITAVRIDPIAFEPGSLKPDPKSAKRLERLLTFLRKRPKIELQIRGRASRKEAKALARQRGRVATKQQLQRLAEDRARLIERTLVRRGIAQKRLYVVTEDPKAVRKRAPGRVEFRLLN